MHTDAVNQLIVDEYQNDPANRGYKTLNGNGHLPSASDVTVLMNEQLPTGSFTNILVPKETVRLYAFQQGFQSKISRLAAQARADVNSSLDAVHAACLDIEDLFDDPLLTSIDFTDPRTASLFALLTEQGIMTPTQAEGLAALGLQPVTTNRARVFANVDLLQIPDVYYALVKYGNIALDY